MSTFDNQEAFTLSAKRLKSRITKAKLLKVNTLETDGLVDLVESLSLAKAIELEVSIDQVRKGQEYYVQTLIDSLSKNVNELMAAEYSQAVLELGSEEEILTDLETLQAA